MIRSVRFLLLIGAICSGVLLVAFMQDKSLIKLDAPIVNGERYIVIVIPSYNNSRWCRPNITNVFGQHYSNYQVIYIDDCSTDDTYDAVCSLVKELGKQDHITLIRNSERHGALYNLYHAIHSLPDKAIVVTLDGDDWFKTADVLSTINQAYSDPSVWLTYGQFEEFPRGSLGICHPMPDYVVASKSYRKQDWFTSHLRTFYAGLFKKIKKDDLMLNGEFFSVAWDQAFMFPMLEMADGRIKFIDKIMYIYNQANPLNDFKLYLRKQLECERIIRRKESYAPLNPDQVNFVAR